MIDDERHLLQPRVKLLLPVWGCVNPYHSRRDSLTAPKVVVRESNKFLPIKLMGCMGSLRMECEIWKVNLYKDNSKRLWHKVAKF